MNLCIITQKPSQVAFYAITVNFLMYTIRSRFQSPYTQSMVIVSSRIIRKHVRSISAPVYIIQHYVIITLLEK